ncbi:MAG: DUF3306 domain-containing protein [Azoarcus sp.]|nr:DUF3306 domain-containing protein [Azoarcus sp.]
MSTSDPFLSRWSRLKRTRSEPDTAAVPAVVRDVVRDAPPSVAPASAIDPAAEPALDRSSPAELPSQELPDPATLTLDSDFTAFLKEEVGEAVRRQALKKLFNDPHFNVMDRLDIYIDDYSVSAPIPPEMLAKLRSASEWLAGRDEDTDEKTDEATPATAEGTTRAADDVQTPALEGSTPGADLAPVPAAGLDEVLPVETPPDSATDGNSPVR